MSWRLALVVYTVLATAPAWAIAQDSTASGDTTQPAAQAQPEVVFKAGAINVLETEGKTLFEIPANILGRELFWYAEVVDDPPQTDGILDGSVGSALIRFEKAGGAIYVRDLTDRTWARDHFSQDPQYDARAPSSADKLTPIARAVDESDLPPVMMSFEDLGVGPNGGTVIDVTDLFASDIGRFSVAGALASDAFGGGLLVGRTDPNRSAIQNTRAFPGNVHIDALLTFTPPSEAQLLGDDNVPPADGPLSVVVGHSITLLPEQPMRARLFDDRVGYFNTSYLDYGDGRSAGAREQSIILRRRLEKKDPTQEVSEPIEPIVFYIGREVPDVWRPYIKQAVENWQPAFEEAGFKNAIVAKDAPTPEEDPDWHEDDSRLSIIRWVAEPIANAQGSNIHDPRSGEILSAHILIWEDVLSFAEQVYFTQAGGADEYASRLPLPEEVLGTVLRTVVSHEVGHTLGLRHNMKASQAYTVEQLRDPTFANEHGPVASIMSYGRVNFVAQPGDGVTVFSSQIGPYDRFAISWGYKSIREADSPADEVATLDKWADAQLDNPWLEFGGEDVPAVFDPTVLTETIGEDRIETTQLGLQNLDRVVANLAASAADENGTNEDVAEMYGVLLQTRTGWIRDVAKMVGGQVEHRAQARAGKGPRFVPVPPDDQRQAVAFLMKEGLAPPEKFLDPKLLSLFAVAAATEPVEESQAEILDALLSGRVYSMLHQQSILDPKAYDIAQFLADVTGGVWAEIGQPGTPISPLRRSLQRAFLARIGSQLARQGEPIDTRRLEAIGVPRDAAAILLSRGAGTDFNGALRAVMSSLEHQLEAAAEWTDDPATSAHFGSSLAEIRAILSLTS